MYNTETFVFPPLSSRIVQIDFEFKRRVNDGLYLLIPICNSSIILSHCLVDVSNATALALMSNLSNKNEILQYGEDIGEYIKADNCQIFETNLNLIEEEPNNQSVPEVTDNEADCLVDPDEQLTNLKTDLGEI